MLINFFKPKKVKDYLQKKKTEMIKFSIPGYQLKQQQINQGVDEQIVSPKDKKELIMNTDNFYQFDQNQMNKNIEFLFTNNLSFTPNYNFDYQQYFNKANRTSRYSIANNDFQQRYKKKSIYDHNQLQSPLKQNIQSHPNLIQYNRKSSASIMKMQQQNPNNSAFQLKRQSIPASKNIPTLQQMNSQTQLIDLSMTLNKDANNISIGNITNTLLSPQNGEMTGLVQGGILQKEIQFDDGNNNNPADNEKEPSGLQNQNNLVKLEMKQIQKKEFYTEHDQYNNEIDNENSFYNGPQNTNGVLSFRSKGQSFFASERKQSAKKKQSQGQTQQQIPHIPHKLSNGNQINKSPFINLNGVHNENSNNFKSIFNQPKEFKVKNYDTKSKQQIDKINDNTQKINQAIEKPNENTEKLIEDQEKDIEHVDRQREQNQRRKFYANEIEFSYFQLFEKQNNEQSSNHINYPVLNDLNIIKIFDKLMEFDRLKSIILDTNQQAIFDYIVQSPIGKQEYLNKLLKSSQHQQQQKIGSFHTTSSSRDTNLSTEEVITKGWKAIKNIESQFFKSDIDSRLMESINYNIYCLINSCNMEDLNQQQEEIKNNPNDQINSKQLIINNISDSLQENFPTRARIQAGAVQQRNQRSLSESSCNKAIPDENLNY